MLLAFVHLFLALEYWKSGQVGLTKEHLLRQMSHKLIFEGRDYLMLGL